MVIIIIEITSHYDDTNNSNNITYIQNTDPGNQYFLTCF